MKNNLYRKGFIVPVLLGVIALLIIGGGAYLYKTKKVDAPVVVNENVGLDSKQKVATVKDKNIKTFKLENLEFSYPDNLTLKQTDNLFSLTHSIAQKHQNRCDFVGDNPMLSEIVDVDISLNLVDGGIINTMKSYFSKDDSVANDLLKNNKITLDPGFLDKYKIGELDGYRITRGFEGCGSYYYLFPISSSKTLVVFRGWSSQTVGQTTDAYMLKLPGIISSNQEEQIFKDILSSVKGL